MRDVLVICIAVAAMAAGFLPLLLLDGLLETKRSVRADCADGDCLRIGICAPSLAPGLEEALLSVFDERPSTAVCFYHAASARLYERLEDRTIDIIVQPDDGNDVPPDCRAVTLVQPEAVLRFGGRPVTARACPGENPRQSVVWKREAPPALVVLLADRLQGEGALQSVSNPLNFTAGACAGSA